MRNDFYRTQGVRLGRRFARALVITDALEVTPSRISEEEIGAEVYGLSRSLEVTEPLNFRLETMVGARW